MDYPQNGNKRTRKTWAGKGLRTRNSFRVPPRTDFLRNRADRTTTVMHYGINARIHVAVEEMLITAKKALESLLVHSRIPIILYPAKYWQTYDRTVRFTNVERL